MTKTKGKGTTFKRRSNGARDPDVCHWCKKELTGKRHNKTTPAFSNWPELPVGVGVIVCGEACPERPEGAPVGARLVWNGGS